MSLSSLSDWNGLLIHNLNPLYDPATFIGNKSDWSLSFYYQGTPTGESELFYIGNDNTKYFGVKSLNTTGQLQIYFNNISGVNNGLTSINTNLNTSGSFKLYTFIKQGNSFKIYQGNPNPIELNITGFIYNNPDLFVDFSPVANINYMCVGGSPLRVCGVDLSPPFTATNFIQFFTVPLSNTFLTNYYRLIYENDGANLICNIRGETDYTTKGLIVERDIYNSDLNLVDVCGV